MSRVYMGQIMAECDCQHSACEQRGYCMAERIKDLEAKLSKAVCELDSLGFDWESNVGRAIKGGKDD